MKTLAYLLCGLLPLALFAEGTPQLRPAYTDNAHLVVMSSADNRFAAYDALPNNRLQFYINTLGETVYFGFGNLKVGEGANIGSYDEDLTGLVATNPDVYYRIIDPAGTVVASGLLPQTPGPGYIGDYTNAAYDRAVAGPAALVGVTGYDAISFTPTLTGDYRMEFNIGDINGSPIDARKTSIQLFDLTVADAGGTIIPGRLWSKAWRFSTGANQTGGDPFEQYRFKASLYPYAEDGDPLTNDGVVTKLDFNGMDPFGFIVSCNRDGVQKIPPANDFVLEKRSQFTFITPPDPLYKIFLNDPDASVYPSGVVGCLTGTPSVTQCTAGSAYCINVFAVATGEISVLIDLDKNDGLYTPGTRDVLIRQNITNNKPTLSTCVPWDGRDGLGVQVPDGTVNIVVIFQAGLTNLPINDVENNVKGFIVTLQRPSVNFCGTTISPPLLYWSDKDVLKPSAMPMGDENLLGCDPVATGGCHRWTNRGDNGPPYEKETMNTWWYIAQEKQTLNFINDNSLFGISANFGNASCQFTDFATIDIDVEYSLAKFNPTGFTYAITPQGAGYQFINQVILNPAAAGSSAGKKIVKLRYTIDIGNDNANTGAMVASLGFDYKVQTNQCGSPLQVSNAFMCVMPLPVVWLSFGGQVLANGQVRLDWQTAREENNARFTIERSQDGKTFQPTASLDGSGNTSATRSYNFIDSPSATGAVLYYRIRQTDSDGKTSTSKVISLRLPEVSLRLLSLVYEPSQREIQLSLSSREQPRVGLYSFLGQLLLEKKGVSSSEQDIRLSTEGLAAGVYIVEVSNNSSTIRKRIVVY